MKVIVAALALVLSVTSHSTACAWPAKPATAPANQLTFKNSAPIPEPAAPVTKKAPAAGAKKIKAYRFSDGVSNESVAAVQKFLQRAMQDKLDYVLLELDTPGGSYDAGHDLTRYIEVSPVPVICVVDGRAASMGFYILQACDRRIITPRSMLMAHSAGLIVKSDEGVLLNEATLATMLNHVRVLNRAYAGQVAMKLKLTADQYLAKISEGKEWWMNADEALQVGAVDVIWKGTPNTLFQALRSGQTP